MNIQEEKQEKNYQIKFFIEENNVVIAWAFLVVIFNGRHKECYGLMEDVYVLPAYRGHGYGSALIQKLITKARDIGCYKLIAQSRYDKEHVHALYKKYGFRDHGKNFRMDLKQTELLADD